MAYLDGFLNLDLASDAEKETIRAAKKAIQSARFQNLQRQINQLHRSTKQVRLTPVALLAKLIEILHGYPLATNAGRSQAIPAVMPQAANADIILSESFDGPHP